MTVFLGIGSGAIKLDGLKIRAFGGILSDAFNQLVRSWLARILLSKEQAPVLLVPMVVCPMLQQKRIQKVMLLVRSRIRPTLRLLALIPLTVLSLMPRESLLKNCWNTSFCTRHKADAFSAWITTRGSPVLR